MADFLAEHQVALATYNGFLELAVPKAFAMFEEDYPDIRKVPGDALCSAVRAVLRSRGEQVHREDCSLDFAARGTSRHLVDGEGTSVRILRHPWNFKAGCRIGVVEPPVYTLWGIDWSRAPYELAILWTPDYDAKALDSAVLAAVGGLGESTCSIYARSYLPRTDVLSIPRAAPGGGSRMGDITDDFDDFLDEESFGADDPA